MFVERVFVCYSKDTRKINHENRCVQRTFVTSWSYNVFLRSFADKLEKKREKNGTAIEISRSREIIIWVISITDFAIRLSRSWKGNRIRKKVQRAWYVHVRTKKSVVQWTRIKLQTKTKIKLRARFVIQRAPVVQKVVNAIWWINLCWVNFYFYSVKLLDRALSFYIVIVA